MKEDFYIWKTQNSFLETILLCSTQVLINFFIIKVEKVNVVWYGWKTIMHRNLELFLSPYLAVFARYVPMLPKGTQGLS